MDEQNKKPQPGAEDDIGTSLSASGARIPALDRLTQVANDMTQLEWKLLRSKAKRVGAGGDSSPK